MKQLLEFLPLVIFFLTFQLSGTTVAVGDVVYTFDGIYSATIALISATFLQLLIVKLACAHFSCHWSLSNSSAVAR